MRRYSVGVAGLAVNQLFRLGWFDSITAHGGDSSKSYTGSKRTGIRDNCVIGKVKFAGVIAGIESPTSW